MTPPEAPKMAAAPVETPSMGSNAPSAGARRAGRLGDHAAQLPGGEGHVHRHAAVGQPLLLPQYLVLLGGAGHDGHHEDVLGIDARLLGVVGLDQGAEHLLGGLAGGDVVEHVGGVLLQIPHPAGGAGGDEGEGAAAVEAA